MNLSPNLNLKFLSVGLVFMIAGCQPQSKPDSQAIVQKSATYKKLVVAQGVQIVGPQVVMVGLTDTFKLDVPAGVVVADALWNFGDGSLLQTGLGSLDYVYSSPGTYTISVSVTLSTGEKGVLSHPVQVVESNDAQLCVSELALRGPQDIVLGTGADFAVTIPTCLSYVVKRVEWNFADGSVVSSGLTAKHIFSAAGDYHVTAQLYLINSTVPYATLYLDTSVASPAPPPPAPVNECSAVGLERELLGAQTNEEQSCGVGGKRTNTYQEQILQKCSSVNDTLKWVEVSRSKQLVTEGACEGQSCDYVDPATGSKGTLANGASRAFYSSMAPVGDCASASINRTCQNGVLSGESSFNQLSCHAGCGAFGVHGTVQLGVVTGQESVPHLCAFNEPGILDVFSVVSDQTCQDGVVLTSNTRRGSLTQGGQCPTYSWAAVDQYSACSADCGGQQTQLFNCLTSTGEVAPADRCAGQAPVVTRVCDGNPDAVKRSETTSILEQAGQSKICPAHKVGTVTQKREVSTITNYACVNHQVQTVSQNVVEGAWVTEELCRDFGTRRCSEDSLDVEKSKQRYRWMVKCAPKVKVIREFFEEFKHDEHANMGRSCMKYGRDEVYASFVDRHTGKSWVAPKKESAGCEVPEHVEVATVCSADCATPEEQILSQSDRDSKMTYAPFVEAWDKNFMFVASLPDASSLNTSRVARVPVDRWVTQELDGEHDMVELKMASGRSLKVTPRHHLVAADGSLKTAEDFKVGESLVQLGGKLDPIVSVDHSKYYGKLYNLYVKSSAPHRNIVSTQGYLNGTAYFQSEGVKHLNKVLIRKSLTQGAFKK